MCIVYSAVIPLIIMAAIALIWRRSFWDCHSAILGLLLSVSLTTVFTQVVKVCVGRPRPDLIDRCQPVQGAANAAVYGLATVAVCTVQTGHIMSVWTLPLGPRPSVDERPLVQRRRLQELPVGSLFV